MTAELPDVVFLTRLPLAVLPASIQDFHQFTVTEQDRSSLAYSSSVVSFIMVREKKIRNAVKRGEVHRKDRREKAQEKLKRRMEVRGGYSLVLGGRLTFDRLARRRRPKTEAQNSKRYVV